MFPAKSAKVTFSQYVDTFDVIGIDPSTRSRPKAETVDLISGSSFLYTVPIINISSSNALWLTSMEFIYSVNMYIVTYCKFPVDASPAYLWDFYTWKRQEKDKTIREPRYILPHTLREITPQAKYIFILRNPTDRY